MRRMRPVMRSETSASPPGRNAIPHGTSRPVATVLADRPADAAGDSDPPPHAHRRATTETTARRRMDLRMPNRRAGHAGLSGQQERAEHAVRIEGPLRFEPPLVARTEMRVPVLFAGIAQPVGEVA